MISIASYWGMALIVIPLFTRVWIPIDGTFRLDSDFSKQTIFMGFMFWGFALFPKRYIYKEFNYFYYFLIFLLVHGFWIQWNPYSQAVTTKWLMLSLGCGALTQMISEFRKADKETVFNFVAVSAIIQALWILAQYFGEQPLDWALRLQGSRLQHDNLNGGVVGALTQQTISGAALAVSLPVFFRKKWAYLIPLVLIAGLITMSAMTLAATLTAVIVWAFYRYFLRPDRLLGASIVLSASLVALYFTFYHLFDGGFLDDQLRLEIWKDSFNYMKPYDYIFGGGLGHFDDLFRRWKLRIPGFDHPHNEIVWFVCAFGGVGFVFLGCVLNKLRKFKNKCPILMASFAALVVNSIGNFPLHIPYISLLFMVFLAFYLKENTERA